VRDPLQRQVLHDLERVKNRIWQKNAESEEAHMLADIHANLSRMWYTG
jgi:hypothetical protein